MKTEDEIRTVLKECIDSFNGCQNIKPSIEDTEQILDVQATILSASLAVHFLKWVLNEE